MKQSVRCARQGWQSDLAGRIMFRALYEYRNYIISNAAGELRYRYAGSSLGFFWNIVNPVLQIVVYTFVFSNIMKAKMDGIESTSGFSLYLCAGMFAWISFQECVARGAGVYTECSSFLKKLPVPEYVFVAQKSLSSRICSRRRRVASSRPIARPMIR